MWGADPAQRPGGGHGAVDGPDSTSGVELLWGVASLVFHSGLALLVFGGVLPVGASLHGVGCLV